MMNFKRSLWGYSAEQLMQFLNERSMTFQVRRQELESGLEAITRSGQELEQLIKLIQMQLEQARQRQQVLDSSQPILDLFLNQCQDYVASQAESFMLTNASLLSEIDLQTQQINANHNKLKLFWQNLHSNLGDLLNTVELEESLGKSLLSKYTDDLDNSLMNSNVDSSGAVGHEPLPAKHKWQVVLPEPLSDIDNSRLTQHEPSLVFNAFKITQHDSPPAKEDISQVETENKPLLLIDKISNIIEPVQHTPSATTAGSKLQALIMDDDTTILAMMRIILERDGFSITACNDGYQASQNIDRINPPLLAILATSSLNMSGLELVGKIRSKPEWDHCSIIMLTENSNQQEIMDLMEAGANDCISKPVNTRELVTHIRKLTGIKAVAL